MTPGQNGQLTLLADLGRRFGLTSLEPALQSCKSLSAAETIDGTALGQFNSGKSSLLNSVLGETVFPVGDLPFTAVITRAAVGPDRVVRVTYLDGTVEYVAVSRLPEFVSEGGNPKNRRRVAVVDVFTPALADLPGVRLVDTPGLGSVFGHNSETTRNWMPNVAVALVTVSAERPLSDEDGRLVAEARQTASQVVVMLTKVDLLTDDELVEVTTYLDQALFQTFGVPVPVLPFSARVEPPRGVRQLRDVVLLPVARDVAGERQAALDLKLAALARACRGYLTVGLQLAERADADRGRLRAAVPDESVDAAVIRDALRQSEQSLSKGTRPAFEKLFLARRASVEQRLSDAVAAELGTWQGNLAEQTQRYENWMADRLSAELTPLSQAAAPLAADLLGQAERRSRRVVEAFRDRLSRNIHEATRVAVSPAAWEVQLPHVAAVRVAVSRTFMVNWDLLWWLLPMLLVGRLFRRRVLGRVSWEVEKNLYRLAGDWAGAVDAAVADLRNQAMAAVSSR